MTYNNIMYIAESYIAFMDNQTIYQYNLKKSVLENGIIKNEELFIKAFMEMIAANKLSKLFWNKSIKIIYNVLNHKLDIDKVYSAFRDLNYKNVCLECEIQKYRLNNKTAYLIAENCFRLFYIDKYNQKKYIILDPNTFSTKEIKFLIDNRCANKNLIIIGKLPKIYLSDKLNYYYYEQKDEFFLKNEFQV